jgi:poly-beta-1,6-N-acetyl-D-glucosamine synthase
MGNRLEACFTFLQRGCQGAMRTGLCRVGHPATRRGMWVAVEMLFWMALVGLFYTYIGYPLCIYLLGRFRVRPVQKRPAHEKCSVVISAHNEALALPAKLRSLLEGANGECVEEVWVGSDGSDDGTVAAVEGLGDPRIRVVRFESRRGKPSVLNDLVPRCRSAVVILTDARQEVGEGALGHLLENFADEQVGVVSGELVFRRAGNNTAAAEGMDFYWRYEKFIRRAEARFRSVPGATGALYAVRRADFEPIRTDSLLDDVAIPMLIVLKGRRCVFEERAVVYDIPSETGKAEEIRKRRTIAGNIQLAAQYPPLLAPWRNPIWFEFISHKMIRLISPFLLVALFVTNVALVVSGSQSPISNLQSPFLLTQVLFYLLAVLGLRAGAHTVWTAAPAMFLRLNWTTLRAWNDALRGRYHVVWRRAYADDAGE